MKERVYSSLCRDQNGSTPASLLLKGQVAKQLRFSSWEPSLTPVAWDSSLGHSPVVHRADNFIQWVKSYLVDEMH